MDESPSDLVKKLKEHAKELRKERNQNKKDLRNAIRRNKRLREKAKNLCDNDLVDILRMRATKKVKRTQVSLGAQRTPKLGQPVAVEPEHQVPLEIHQPVLCSPWRLLQNSCV